VLNGSTSGCNGSLQTKYSVGRSFMRVALLLHYLSLELPHCLELLRQQLRSVLRNILLQFPHNLLSGCTQAVKKNTV